LPPPPPTKNNRLKDMEHCSNWTFCIDRIETSTSLSRHTLDICLLNITRGKRVFDVRGWYWGAEYYPGEEGVWRPWLILGWGIWHHTRGAGWNHEKENRVLSWFYNEKRPCKGLWSYIYVSKVLLVKIPWEDSFTFISSRYINIFCNRVSESFFLHQPFLKCLTREGSDHGLGARHDPVSP